MGLGDVFFLFPPFYSWIHVSSTTRPFSIGSFPFVPVGLLWMSFLLLRFSTSIPSLSEPVSGMAWGGRGTNRGVVSVLPPPRVYLGCDTRGKPTLPILLPTATSIANTHTSIDTTPATHAAMEQQKGTHAVKVRHTNRSNDGCRGKTNLHACKKTKPWKNLGRNDE